MNKTILFFFLITVYSTSIAQNTYDSTSHKITMPQGSKWNIVTEGQSFDFSVKVLPAPTEKVTYSMSAPEGMGMKIDASTGRFIWATNDQMVTPDQEEEFYYIVFKAETENWKDSTFAELILLNRSDIVVPKQNKTNTTSSGLQKIIFPVKPGWNVLHEGDTLQFKVQASFTNNQNGKAKFYMEE
ncbi:MAG: hypothetical protein OEW75_08530, partial [Cyclobacteriaceae bacterium]|nr:hypothetical protein [Cyclobacteriaceae bacterium]